MILADKAATLAFGARLAGVLRAGDVVALSGPLGSGKTTLARGCLAKLGYEGEVASPTFTLVQSYGPDEQAAHSRTVQAEPGEGLSFHGDAGQEKESPSTSSGRTVEIGHARLPALHVDLYRLGDAEEADELGLDDALADHALIVEWPERLGGRLWPRALRLVLEPTADGARRLTAIVPRAWEGRWPP